MLLHIFFFVGGGGVERVAVDGVVDSCVVEITVVEIKDARWSFLSGPFAVNNELSPLTVQLVGKDKLIKPESVAFDSTGAMFTGTEDGNIWRASVSETGPDNDNDNQLEVWAYVGGRPLGMVFDGENNLLVTDPFKGLLRVDRRSRLVEILCSRVDEDSSRVSYADGVDVGSDGTIYFTDSTALWPTIDVRGRMDIWSPVTEEFLSGHGTGRLIAVDPIGKKSRVLLSSLYFPNGVAVSQDGSFVLVAESFRFRVRRYWLRGDRAGESDIFIDALPGTPDNISTSKDGTFWLAILSPIPPTIGPLFALPRIRQILVDFPTLASQVKPLSHGHLVQLSPNGDVLQSLQDAKGHLIHHVTGVVNHNNRLYITSLHNNFVATYDLPTHQHTSERSR